MAPATLTITFFRRKKVKVDGLTLTLYEKKGVETISETIEAKHGEDKDPLTLLLETLSDLEQRYSRDEDTLILVETSVNEVVVRSGIMAASKERSYLLFPTIARIHKLLLLKREGEEKYKTVFRKLVEWEPKEEYYVYDGIIEGIGDDMLLVLETDKGKRIMSVEDLEGVKASRTTGQGKKRGGKGRSRRSK